MSISASAPTEAAVSASISTPVRSAVRTVAVTSIDSWPTTRSTDAPCTPMTWASGSNSGVRFAAAIPAMRATASTSPFGTCPDVIRRSTAESHTTVAAAVAARFVGCLSVTSTM